MERAGAIREVRMPYRANSRQAYLKAGGNVSKKSAERGNRACGFLAPGYGLQRERGMTPYQVSMPDSCDARPRMGSCKARRRSRLLML